MDTAIEAGLNLLLRCDGHLLQVNAAERSITHKLAEYYQTIFSSWNVDCEYNRHFDKPKTLGMDINSLLDSMENQLLQLFGENKISLEEKETTASYIHEHRKYIQIAGFPVDTETAFSLYNDIRSGNRHIDEVAGIVYIAIEKHNAATNHSNLAGLYISPDIIVHRRNTDKNYVVIEAKKSSDPHDKVWLFDLLKLIALTSSKGKYKYDYGYFINIPVQQEFIDHTGFGFENYGDFVKVNSR